MNALVAGNGSYIVRLSVRDLHGPTSPFFRRKLSQYWPVLKFTKFAFNSTDSMKSLRKNMGPHCTVRPERLLVAI